MDKIYDAISGLDFRTIVEAGANLGQDTGRLCTMFPEAEVHSFEPVDILFSAVSSLQHRFKNLRLYKVALSDHTGTTDFYLDLNPNGSMGASSILPSHPTYAQNYLRGEEKISIPCITLESFLRDNDIKELDLLWLDVEMTEYSVLKASENVLKDIRYIYLEISYSNFRIGQPTPEMIDALLTGNGFKVVFIEPQGSDKFDWQANALYKKT